MNVFPFPDRKVDRWVMTVDVYRRPDGSIYARLSDMPVSEIERDAEATASDRIRRLAGMLREGVSSLERQADELAE